MRISRAVFASAILSVLVSVPGALAHRGCGFARSPFYSYGGGAPATRSPFYHYGGGSVTGSSFYSGSASSGSSSPSYGAAYGGSSYSPSYSSVSARATTVHSGYSSPFSDNAFFWGGGHSSDVNIAPIPNMGPPVFHAAVSNHELKIFHAAPPPPLSQCIAKLDDNLVELHNSDQLGSFDIDMLSERMLEIRRNYAVMLGSGNRITAAQESVLRSQLAALQDDLQKQRMRNSFEYTDAL